jgi:micrococcal nuclease
MAAIGGAALVAAGGWAVRSPAGGESIAACRVVDGDTLRCGDERVRLLGIDAPELPGHCRTGRACVAGDPYASSASLEAALAPPLSIRRVGADRYGRTLAMVAGRNGDLSCWQLAHGAAIYREDWDNGGLVAAACPSAAR